MRLRAAASAPAGVYRVRVTARGRLGRDARHPLRSARTVLTLVVAEPLGLRTQPALRRVSPGATATFQVRLRRRGLLVRPRRHARRPLAARLWLEVARPLPQGVTAALDRRSTRADRALLTLTTETSLKAGTYRVRLDVHGRIGREPVRRAHVTVTLVVTASPPVTFPIIASPPMPFPISGTAAQPLSPGVSVPLDLHLTNSEDSPLAVQGLVVRVADVQAPEADPGHPCTVADFVATQFSGAYGFLVPGSTTTSLSALGVPTAEWPHVAMINHPVNQDGCKHATLTLDFTGTAITATP